MNPEQIKDLIGKGKTEEALNALLELAKLQKRNEKEDEILLLKSRFVTNENEKRNNLINDNDASVNKTKMDKAILEILEELTAIPKKNKVENIKSSVEKHKKVPNKYLLTENKIMKRLDELLTKTKQIPKNVALTYIYCDEKIKSIESLTQQIEVLPESNSSHFFNLTYECLNEGLKQLNQIEDVLSDIQELSDPVFTAQRRLIDIKNRLTTEPKNTYNNIRMSALLAINDLNIVRHHLQEICKEVSDNSKNN